MKAKFLKLLVALPLLFAACTDLDETYYDDVAPDLVPNDQKISSVYLTLKGSMTGFPETCPWWKLVYAVQTSTDEICIPLQDAADWYDGGYYLQMQSHNWAVDNPIMLASWNYLYNIVSNCNVMLVKFGPELSNEGRAELQTLRAYAYYRLMDLFGGVPLMTEENFDAPQMPAKITRAELFTWVENQLTYLGGTAEGGSLEENLADKKYGAMDKGVLNTLKARLYLNSKVFLGLQDNSPEYNQYLEKAIVACDAVINSGQYSLESNVFANWFTDNGPQSREIIFPIQYVGDGSAEGNRLHLETLAGPGLAMGQAFGNEMYTHGTSGWHVNPGKTADDPDALVNLFHENDNRRLSILTGQMYDRESFVLNGEFVKLTSGNWATEDPNSYAPGERRKERYLNYEPWFYNRGFNPAGMGDIKMNMPKTTGARLIKFELPDAPTFYENSTDMVVMRYAEVLYTKAEALIRLGRAAQAVPLFQQVLANRGFDPTTPPAGYNKNYPFLDMGTNTAGEDTELKISGVALMSKRWLSGATTDLTQYMPIPATPDLEFMDQEWRREFVFEDRRRTDMIRMNKFITGTWGGKETPTNDPTRNLFPIPKDILDRYPAVVQNPGY